MWLFMTQCTHRSPDIGYVSGELKIQGVRKKNVITATFSGYFLIS